MVKISWSRKNHNNLETCHFQLQNQKLNVKYAAATRTCKISVSKASGWKCLHTFIYFTDTWAYQTKSLIEGLEKCFKRNQGSVCSRTASYCVALETAGSRKDFTQHKVKAWEYVYSVVMRAVHILMCISVFRVPLKLSILVFLLQNNL